MIELTFAQIFLDKVLIEVADVEHCTEANHPLFRQRKSLNRTAGGQLAVQHDEMIVALPKSTAGFLWKEATHGYQRNYHQFQRIMSHWFPWFWVSPCIPYFLSDKAMRKEPKTSWWWRWFQGLGPKTIQNRVAWSMPSVLTSHSFCISTTLMLYQTWPGQPDQTWSDRSKSQSPTWPNKIDT